MGHVLLSVRPYVASYNITYESQIEEEEFLKLYRCMGQSAVPASSHLDGFKSSKMFLLGSKTILYDI